MKTYKIMKDTCELRTTLTTGWTEGDIFGAYQELSANWPHVVETYDGIETAKAAWWESYAGKGSTTLQHGSAGYYLLADVYYLEEFELDEDGEIDQGEILYYTAQPFAPDGWDGLVRVGRRYPDNVDLWWDSPIKGGSAVSATIDTRIDANRQYSRAEGLYANRDDAIDNLKEEIIEQVEGEESAYGPIQRSHVEEIAEEIAEDIVDKLDWDD